MKFQQVHAKNIAWRTRRALKSRDQWSRPISGRRGTSIIHTGPRDPLQYINGANTYQFVGSSPVGMVDAEGTASGAGGGWVPMTDIGGNTYWINTQTGQISYSYPSGPMAPVGPPSPPFGLSADRWENPGAHFVGGMGKFTAQVDWNSAQSSGVAITFFPGKLLKEKKCACKLIGFVQYEKDATSFSSRGSVGLPSGWSVDGGFPYPHQTEWSPSGGGYAELRDNPKVKWDPFWLLKQWVFEARDVAVCLRGA